VSSSDAGSVEEAGSARLAAVPFLREASPKTLEQLAAIATAVATTPGQVLTQAGAPGSGLFVVDEGVVEVERPGHPSIELGPGECFGELALLTDDGVRTARVRAKTAGRCWAIPRADFVDLLHREPSVAVALLGVLAQRLAGTLR
jgi:CRP/FNR family cyclic AMP-dependent transcriptional regulator